MISNLQYAWNEDVVKYMAEGPMSEVMAQRRQSNALDISVRDPKTWLTFSKTANEFLGKVRCTCPFKGVSISRHVCKEGKSIRTEAMLETIVRASWIHEVYTFQVE